MGGLAADDVRRQDLFVSLCARERCPYSVVGQVEATGRIVVRDGVDEAAPVVVDLSLEKVLGKMPPKTFESARLGRTWLVPLAVPEQETVASALERVLRLLSVGSKRFLTNKVDRCVSGLVAQQQCVGPLHTPLADVAVLAQSHLGLSGVATASGEQPIKGLVSPRAGARMSAGEALTNLVWAKVTRRGDVKCRGNWMWAAKLEGEGADMYDACRALCDALLELGVGMDGGKDSLSMAAKVDGETVKVRRWLCAGLRQPQLTSLAAGWQAPGQVCVSVYGMVPDITLTVTPDLKPVPGSVLVFADLSLSGRLDLGCLGGSALAHVYGQLGNDAPDFDSKVLARAFDCVQELLSQGAVLAGHDRSDGGLLTAVLEMAFAGNCGVALELAAEPQAVWRALFGEDLGLVLQLRQVRTRGRQLAAGSWQRTGLLTCRRCAGG
jgi:phosphoribosylformylglycinamidine synthase